MTTLPAPIECFTTRSGIRIYRLPMTVFYSGFRGYAYVILGAGVPTLVDTGSGIGDSNAHLLAGIEALRADFGEPLQPADIRRIILTHGHIDHFGGMPFILEQIPNAELGVHKLDQRVLTNYTERVVMATKDLRIYLERAGVAPDERQQMIAMYGFAKQHMRSMEVHFNPDEDHPIDGMTFIHVPGHCPGQICIRLDEVLLCADHVLSRTTPHQSPESITHYMGLGHYRESLHKLAQIDGIELALGGHEDPMTDLYGRITEIEHSHNRKLERVLETLRAIGQPATINAITRAIYPDKTGYDTLLAIEEIGAHIEYLYHFGALSVVNLDEIEREDNPAWQFTAS